MSPELHASLDFWAGPKKIGSVRLRVLRETWAVDPFVPDNPAPPDIGALPPQAAGIFRRSEPQSDSGVAAPKTKHVLRYVVRRYNRRFIDLRADFDSYMKTFSGKTRSTLRRKLRKMESASGGTIDWRTFRTQDEMEEFHRHARAVSALTYQEKLFDAGIPGDPGWIAEMRALARTDSVRGYLLFLSGEPIAYLYCPVQDARVTYGYLGFDPRQAALSPGTLLQLLATEQLFADDRFRLFDFTEGEGAHKELFSTHQRLCADVLYLRPTIVNWLLTGLHRSNRALFDAADRLMARIGLRTWLRQKFRGQRD